MSKTPIKARKLTKDTDSQSSQLIASPFDSIPNELLVQILSFLPARSLLQAPLVCKRWSTLLKEDDVWKAAIHYHWGRFPLSDIAHGSWRQEYRLRANSRELWGYGEDCSILFDPRLGGVVDVVHVEPFPLRLLCGSTKTGNVSECDLSSGTVRLSLSTQQTQEVAWLDIKGCRVTVGQQDGRILLFTKNTNTAGQHPAAARQWQKKIFNPRYELIPGCFAKHEARAITVDQLGITRIYDLEGASEDIITFPSAYSQASVTSVALSPPKEILVYGFEDGMVWFTALNGTLLATQKLFEGLAISFIKCGGELALIGSATGKMVLCSIPSGEIHCVLDGLAELPTSVKWEPSLNVVAVGSNNGSLLLWQYPKHPKGLKDPVGPLWERFAHSGRINAIHLDGYKLVTGGEDSLVKVWDTLNGVLIRTLERRSRGTKNGGRQIFDDPIDALHVEGSRIILTSNGKVKCSTFAPKKEVTERKKEKEKGTPKAPKRRQSPTKFGVETIRKQVDEGLYELEATRSETRHRAEVLFSHTIPGLSEEELLQYALMLSTSEHPSLSSEELQLQWAMQQSSLAE